MSYLYIVKAFAQRRVLYVNVLGGGDDSVIVNQTLHDVQRPDLEVSRNKIAQSVLSVIRPDCLSPLPLPLTSSRACTSDSMSNHSRGGGGGSPAPAVRESIKSIDRCHDMRR